MRSSVVIAVLCISAFEMVEAGKLADLFVSDANPLAKSRNLRESSVAMRDGRLMDGDRLPLQRVRWR